MFDDIAEKFKRDMDEIIKNIMNPSVAGILSQSSRDLSLQKKPDIDLLEWSRWLNIIKHPSVILIVGRRDSGKSALGFKIPEYLRLKWETYVIGLPQKARKLLPDWIGITPSLEDIPPKSIVLIDESYNLFHSRASASERARILSNLINLSRQREQTLIFVTQEARQIDKNTASSGRYHHFQESWYFSARVREKGIEEDSRRSQSDVYCYKYEG